MQSWIRCCYSSKRLMIFNECTNDSIRETIERQRKERERRKGEGCWIKLCGARRRSGWLGRGQLIPLNTCMMTAPAYNDVMLYVCTEQGQIISPAPCIVHYRVAPLCVYVYECVCVCVEHENVPWSLNRVGTSQSFIIFALFLFFFVYFCSTSVFLSFRLSLCFLFLVYDKFNDLFVVLCFRRCLSSTHNTATRDYVMFVVYLVVVSTFFFFLLPSLLYFVLRKQVLRHGVYSTEWYWYCRGRGEPSVKLCKLKFDMRN